MNDAILYGDEYSSVEKDFDDKLIGYKYTTNQGQVLMSPRGILLECIYGIGRNMPGSYGYEVQIDDRKYFRVSTICYAASINDELINDKRMSRANSTHPLQSLEVNLVLKALLEDDHWSFSSKMVKKALFQLILKDMTLDKEGKALAHQILSRWRIPIVKRTPIITGGVAV